MRSPHNLVGVVLLGGGVAAVLLPVIEQEQHAAVRWWLFGLAAGLLACFVAWEILWRRTGRDPLVDLALLRARSFGLGSAVGSVYFAGYTGLLLILPLSLQQGQGYSALQAGATGLPFALDSALTSTLGGRAVFRFGRPMVLAGITAVVLGLTATAAVSHHPHGALWWYVLGPLLLAGLGSGLVIGPNQTLALATYPPPAAVRRPPSCRPASASAPPWAPPWPRTCSTAVWPRPTATSRAPRVSASTAPPPSPAPR
ncbi:hypothetical protein [Streptomyces mexicanus]|uniref:hypothetical protein n=1 Tax=Streptomyces mexicanus TaxID=178566 RepID=UPI0031EC3BEC